MINKNTFHICYYCLDYMSNLKSDVNRHLNKLHKCKPYFILFNFEEASKKSLYTKYIFHIDKNNLTKNDLLFIISNYNNNKNHIFENFRDPLIIAKNNDSLFTKEELEIQYNKNEEKVISELEEEILEQIIQKDKIKNEEYKCYHCESLFTTKHNLLKHLENETVCNNRKKQNELLKKNKEEEFKKRELTNYHNQSIINNIQNIENQQNNNILNNNMNKNNFQVKIKDFVKENYDLSHIDDSFYNKKDFFLYNNFLSEIMLNEKNRNVYFIDNEAIFLNNNQLNKMSDEKAEYLILEKMEKSFQLFLNKQNEDTKKYYNFITKYYHVIKGHCKHDTILKNYDINERKFIYEGNSSMFRARDVYLINIKKIFEKHDKDIQEKLSKYSDGGQIFLSEPNIEDFASKRSRYRDLKSKE